MASKGSGIENFVDGPQTPTVDRLYNAAATLIGGAIIAGDFIYRNFPGANYREEAFRRSLTASSDETRVRPPAARIRKIGRRVTEFWEGLHGIY